MSIKFTLVKEDGYGETTWKIEANEKFVLGIPNAHFPNGKEEIEKAIQKLEEIIKKFRV